MKTSFPKHFLQEVLWGGHEEADVVSDEIDDTGRWSEYHTLIFKYQDKFYQVEYSEGLTENQDERPWQEYRDNDEIDVVEVEPYEKVIVAYRPLKR